MKRFHIVPLVIVIIWGMLCRDASCSLKFINRARLKPATMSSTLNSKYSADKAVDNNDGGDFFSDTCTLTKDYKSWHWWQVDLQDFYNVTTVRIVNRNDCCGENLQGFTIEVSEEEPSTLPGFPKTTTATDCLTRKAPISPRSLLECDQPVTGRYFRIVKESVKGMPLTLCNVEVFGIFFRGNNLAFGNPTARSSLNYDEKKYENISSNRAESVNEIEDFNSSSCSETEIGGAWNWWQVDLQETFSILAVRITNRNDCCGYRLQGFTIEVSYEKPSSLPGFPATTNAAICLTRKDAIPSSGQFLLDCDQPVYGRYLRIVKESDKDRSLTLCDVEVYGRFFRGSNLAIGRPTRQSSTQNIAQIRAYSKRAVDGNVYGLFEAGSCTHTRTRGNYWEWWQVDLQGTYNISAVRITNRLGPNRDRLYNFTIEVSDVEPCTLPGFPATTNAAICMMRKDVIPNLGPFMLKCDKPVQGRYLRIVKENEKKTKPLTLCEVEVYEPFAERIDKMNGKNGLWRFIEIAQKGSKDVLTSSRATRMMSNCARQRILDQTDLYTNPYIHLDLQTGSCSFANSVLDRRIQRPHNWVLYRLE